MNAQRRPALRSPSRTRVVGARPRHSPALAGDWGTLTSLQRDAGNRAVARLLTSGSLRTPSGLRLPPGVLLPPGLRLPTVSRSLVDQATTAGERKKLQVLTVEAIPPMSRAKIASYFRTSDKVRLKGVTARFDTSIPATVQDGLHSIAAASYSGSGFRDRTIFHARLDLTPFGGATGVYRFVLIPKPKNTGLLLIELASTAPATRLTTKSLAAQKKRFARFGYQFGAGFQTADRQTKLLTALSRIPDSVLSRVTGATFVLSSSNKGMQGEAGHYDPNTHTVKLFQAALSASFNSPDTGGADFFTAALTHEVSHAVDFQAFRRAADAVATIEAKIKAVDAKLRTLDRVDLSHPLAGLAADPLKDKKRAALTRERQRLAKLRNQAVKAQNAAARATLSSSKGFGAAAGKTAISKYGATAAVENFAELLTLYILDPALLKSLRPSAHAYFAKILK